MKPDDIKRLFTDNPLKPGQKERMQAIKNAGAQFAQVLLITSKESAEQTLAIRAVEEAVSWGSKAITNNE